MPGQSGQCDELRPVGLFRRGQSEPFSGTFSVRKMTVQVGAKAKATGRKPPVRPHPIRASYSFCTVR